MLVVGLTGGIASGKSTVSSLFGAHHIPIVDADILARKVVEPGKPAYSKIVSYFGREVLLPNGNIDRPKLGSIIFNDDAKRKKLNSIVHPAVRKAMAWEVLKFWIRGEKICIVDVPLLIEAGLWQYVGRVIVVYCSRELQLQRLMKRDSSNREAALSRLNSQLALSSKLEYADHVIDNSGSLQDLESQVIGIVKRLEKDASWTWRLNWLLPPLGLVSGLLCLAGRIIRRKYKRNRRRRGEPPVDSIDLKPNIRL
ncbi:hypothetical protein FRC02_010474 [Tulasnella sp. 418]|nr:hypothetical protein FRC02_010474 [Tulasnella sp. 418]